MILFSLVLIHLNIFGISFEMHLILFLSFLNFALNFRLIIVCLIWYVIPMEMLLKSLALVNPMLAMRGGFSLFLLVVLRLNFHTLEWNTSNVRIDWKMMKLLIIRTVCWTQEIESFSKHSCKMGCSTVWATATLIKAQATINTFIFPLFSRKKQLKKFPMKKSPNLLKNFSEALMFTVVEQMVHWRLFRMWAQYLNKNPSGTVNCTKSWKIAEKKSLSISTPLFSDTNTDLIESKMQNYTNVHIFLPL